METEFCKNCEFYTKKKSVEFIPGNCPHYTDDCLGKIKNNRIDKVQRIKRDWYWLDNRVIYAQLIERLEKHGLETDEAIDILFIAHNTSIDEHIRGLENYRSQR